MVYPVNVPHVLENNVLSSVGLCPNVVDKSVDPAG